MFTIGARLRASASARKVETALFTAPRRWAPSAAPRRVERPPVKALKAALGVRGQVNSPPPTTGTPSVRSSSPGPTNRYTSVITALLALRKEKLSRNLDLVELSKVLTDALPPINEHGLARWPRLRRLDRREEELRKLEAGVAPSRCWPDAHTRLCPGGRGRRGPRGPRGGVTDATR